MGRNVCARCRRAGLWTLIQRNIVASVGHVNVVSIVVGRVPPSNTVEVIVMVRHIGGQLKIGGIVVRYAPS